MRNLNEAVFGVLVFIASMLIVNVLYFAPWFFPSIQDKELCSVGETLYHCE